MFKVEQTDNFRRWFEKLKDSESKARIDMRLRRLRRGSIGDAKALGRGVSELRIDYGPGYRVYFMRKDAEIILLLLGGDKRHQAGDILLAMKLAEAERDKE